MNHQHSRTRVWGTVAGAGVVFAGILAFSVNSLTFAQNQKAAQTTQHNQKEDSSQPMCPMMAGLKGIKLAPTSPPLLMARAEELKLTDQQQQELKSIAKEAQRKATEVLNAEQQSALGESPDTALSMNEVAMMRSEKMQDGKSGNMCPMCRKMMEKKKHSNNN